VVSELALCNNMHGTSLPREKFRCFWTHHVCHPAALCLLGGGKQTTVSGTMDATRAISTEDNAAGSV